MVEDMIMDKVPMVNSQLIIYAAGPAFAEEGKTLAARLISAYEADLKETTEKPVITYTEDFIEAEASALYLRLDGQGLTLCGGGQELRGDLTRMLPRLKKGRLEGELLVKAARIRNADGPLLAIDATAGMGEDSILLAAAGFTVRLFERDPVIAALLEDALRRALLIPELSAIAGRMHLSRGDSIEALRSIARQQLEHPDVADLPDVIVLDPMFPERQKSAQVKKKFQLLHQLEKPCDEEVELLEAAIAAHPRKIVIKRPVKGPNLAGRKPDYTMAGKAVRYDCISIAR